jgi:hypothetical protein
MYYKTSPILEAITRLGSLIMRKKYYLPTLTFLASLRLYLIS